MKNLLPFSPQVHRCDVCKGTGYADHTDFAPMVRCGQCGGYGEVRVPKAIAGPENHALNHERPQFDWSRFLGAMDIFCENVREVESLGNTVTMDLQDADLNDLASDMLAALNQAGEKARQLLRRAEALKTR